MSKRLKQGILVVVILFAAAQFIRPDRTNGVANNSRSIQGSLEAAHGLAAVLDRSCSDCHSNQTAWPWYTRVAPLSWVMAAGVKKGREAVNFSEWSAYNASTQHDLLVSSCKAVSNGTMPGSVWTALHPEARLSKQDIDTICAAARQEEAP